MLHAAWESAWPLDALEDADKAKKTVFLINELNRTMANLMIGDDISEHFFYIKVLIGFMFLENPRVALESMVRGIKACEGAVNADGLEPVATMLTTIASSMFTLRDRNVVLAELDSMEMHEYHSSALDTFLLGLLMS